MGHPRSGTVYMSLLMQAFGKDVGDENRMGKDGISSFLIGAMETPRWGPDPWLYDFKNRMHLVRNPIEVISSVLACVTEGVQEYMARECGVDPETPCPRRTVEVYLAWDKLIRIRKPNMRVKVEDAPEFVGQWLGMKVPAVAKLPPTDTNCREQHLGGLNPPDVSMDYLRDNMPLGVFYHFQDLIKEYGYQP